MNQLLIGALIVAASLLPAAAKAQSCGDTLYSNTTLQHDIVCPIGSPFGLRIAAPNVTLDLNGFSIIVQTNLIYLTPVGPHCTPGATGVEVERASGATIRNGRIFDSGTCSSTAIGVQIVASDASTIEDLEIEAPAGIGIQVRGSSDSIVSKNRFFTYLAVRLLPDWVSSQRSDRTLFVDNMMPAMSAYRYGFLFVLDSDDTEVLNNIVDGAAMLVHADSGSDGLRIIGNSIRPSPAPYLIYPAIWIENSQKAFIQNNTIDNGGLGMRLQGYGHVVRDNHVSGSDVAIALGSWAPALKATVSGNFLTTLNKGIGLLFGQLAEYNDARGNTYGNVNPPVLDQGTGNLY